MRRYLAWFAWFLLAPLPPTFGADLLGFGPLTVSGTSFVIPNLQAQGIITAFLSADSGITKAGFPDQNSWNFTGWDQTNFEDASLLSDRWYATFGVAQNTTLTLSDFDLRLQNSETGPQRFTLQAIVNNGTPITLLDSEDISAGLYHSYLGVSLSNPNAPNGLQVHGGDTVNLKLVAWNSSNPAAGTLGFDPGDTYGLLLRGSSVFAGPKTWTGGSPANPSGFADANNWSPTGVPGASDDIQFGSSPSNVVALPGGANPGATVRDIAIVYGASPVTFGAFGVNTPLNASSLTMSGGTSLTLNNTDLSIDSDVSILGSLAVNGGATLKAGSLAVPGTHSVNVPRNGTVTIDGGGAMQASGLVADGTVNLNNGSLTVSSISGSGRLNLAMFDANLHVTGSGGLTLGDNQVVRSQSGQSIDVSYAGSQLTVDGPLTLKHISSGAATLSLTYAGGIVTAGSLTIDGGYLFSQAGSFSVAPGGSISVHSDVSNNQGKLEWQDPTINGGRAVTVGAGGTFKLINASSMAIGGTSPGTVTVESGGSLQLTLGGGGLNSDVIVGNRGLLDLKNGSTFTTVDGSSLIINSGGKVAADIPLSISSGSLTNQGEFLARGGLVFGSGAGVVDGAIENGATGTFGTGLSLESNTFSSLSITGGSTMTADAVNIGSHFESLQNRLFVGGGIGISRLSPVGAEMPIIVGNAFANLPNTAVANTLKIQSGGLVDTGTATTTINNTGSVTLDGGTLRTNNVVRNGTLTFNSGTLALTRTTGYTVDATSELGANPTLGSGKTLEINPTAITTIPSGQSFTLNGGTLNTGSLSLTGGTFNFNAGTLGITGTAGLTIGSGGFFGSSFTVGSGRTVNATNATINSGSTLTLGGGGFGSDNLTNNGTVFLNGGSLSTLTAGGTLTNSSTGRIFVPNSSLVSMGGAMTNANGGRITLQGGAAQLNGTGALTNSGLITGDGEIAKSVTNALTGEIRATAGQSLLFSSANGTNAGKVIVLGGSVEFSLPITNASAGAITGHGSYFFAGGLTNQGQMQFSGGNSDVYGNVVLTGGVASNSKVINAAGANVVTFFGNFVHNGSEVRTAEGSSTVFFGDVTGAGAFTGSGEADFEGAYSPGNSPASVSVEGGLRFGSNSALTMELAGATPGTQYDQLHIGGSLNVGGSLMVTLLNGFSPVSGQAFDLFDWGSLSGQFASITLPALAGGLSWNTSQLYTRGIISIGKPGDFNGDTVSDAADYVLLRHAGGSGAAANYNVWRSNYGLGGSGSGSGAFSAIPEPVSATMAFFCAAALMLTTRHRLGRTETVSSVL